MPALETINTPFTDSAGAWSPEPVSWAQAGCSVYTSSGIPINLNQGTRIPDSDCELAVSLVVSAELTPDGWLVRSGFLEEESYGEDREAALLDFLTSLYDRRQSLERRESALAEPERDILHRLRAMLQTVASPPPNL